MRSVRLSVMARLVRWAGPICAANLQSVGVECHPRDSAPDGRQRRGIRVWGSCCGKLRTRRWQGVEEGKGRCAVLVLKFPGSRAQERSRPGRFSTGWRARPWEQHNRRGQNGDTRAFLRWCANLMGASTRARADMQARRWERHGPAVTRACSRLPVNSATTRCPRQIPTADGRLNCPGARPF
eukprot:scaffold17457_cov105-Isochrysis_galbana.AAC.1